MVLVEAYIEIAAPPERVREVFLDWPKISEWTTHFKSIEVLGPKKPTELQKGDKVRPDFGSMALTGVIEENTARRFTWKGGVQHVFYGVHTFGWKPSEKTPGYTTFECYENFTGALAFTMKMGGTEENFNKLCRALKQRVESLDAAKQQPTSV